MQACAAISAASGGPALRRHAGVRTLLRQDAAFLTGHQRIVGARQQAHAAPGRVAPRAVQTPSRPAPASPAPQQKLQQTGGSVVQLYRYPGLTASKAKTLLRKAQDKASSKIVGVDGELCYNISTTAPLTAEESETLAWLLRETFEPELLTGGTEFPSPAANDAVVEVGPRMSFSTAWCANALSICASCGLDKVDRIEVSRRYLLRGSAPLSAEEHTRFAALVHDRMTEQIYPEPLASFASATVPAPVTTIPVLAHGRAALEAINKEMGLAFDEWDLDYYTAMFRDELKRDPTNVELFDMAQSNSEHSRHWFFNADLYMDGEKTEETLFDIVKDTWLKNKNNSVIGFKDNSSAIRGGPVTPLLPAKPGGLSELHPQERDWDVLLTAETHNFPCAVAPYPGAETGAGGRIRDTHATGIGSMMGAATAGYCTGNLHIDGYELPWEDESFEYPASLAPPLQILIDASNGASDYGNKFGEPLVCGYTRTFGQRLPSGERREWIKPIMFSGGLGQIDHSHLYKNDPDLGMLVVKIGGPAYRIGMGGGAASSVPSGSNSADLDFNAVQRGDAEVSQKLWRVVRACVELGEHNPIEQIHDQGAGGNCNVVKEIIYPLGAEIDVRAIKLGDKTMSVLEIWGAEYQENDCLLIKPDKRALLESICARERCLMQVIGTIDGSGRVVLKDAEAPEGTPTPVDLDLEKVLGDMPNKTFKFERRVEPTSAVSLPAGTTTAAALDRVLRLPSVCSKRFLTTKVDRSVTGLIAQQQCCGPLQLPVSDVAVMAQTHFGLTGAATAIGEQPLKGLIDPKAMARLALGEALTNLVFVRVTALRDIKASVNWMYAAKMGSEGAAMYDAAVALRDAMVELEVAVDGGKDSLSMAAGAGGETVMAPGNLVVSAYVTCPDVTKVVTPDLKAPGASRLLHVDLGAGQRRLGGSALAQAYMQVGDASPDVEPKLLKAAFNTTQQLLEEGKLLAGHDISDGGIVTAVLEMAFAGNCGVSVDLPAGDAMSALFAEELGLVLEVVAEHEAAVLQAYAAAGVPCAAIGATQAGADVSIAVGGQQQIAGTTPALRDVWEATSFQLERLQAAEECVEAEAAGLAGRTAPQWRVPFTPSWTPADKLAASDKVRVAIIREEGSNGDREMAAAVYTAGMQPVDVHMSDLLAGTVSLDAFQGIVFVGGFSYADVMDSAKGWAGTIRFNERLWAQFQAFYARPDTFSLGVCNGCQLMALLGWVPATSESSDGPLLEDSVQPRFVHNASGRFESRWAMVRIEDDSPAIMLRGMGGSQIGVWCAHGEGQAHFPSEEVQRRVMADTLAPIRYCDSDGQPTGQYPFNPNGSPEGIAALCSPDGRHLAMMPHPERCFMLWQHPWYPRDLGLDTAGPGPWLRLFQNAREWSEAHRQ
ncbi:putative phosphoribosylformylglycinamidine chloroplastic mitochondrial [Micractinium conductrix]|uniref:phosphoribosylformylglycinamidine synthase n=1 Tax=Micractinium conductrix TaxID=554055 RepID=A0A2P6VH94_9CHLO|nr:putative phosphoribosylformylglycinamidine chloroplastic mitochondrial [Micractinium conductrix]|eukprot:PSC73466.1 putative phosphoribosylformylglycinamidine chloroplastic mitochondrial [Micractinium conductrix]